MTLYYIKGGKVEKMSAKEYEEYLADPLREGMNFYDGEAGLKLAKDTIEHGEHAAFHRKAQDELGLTDNEYGRMNWPGFPVPFPNDEQAEVFSRRLTGRD